MRALLVTAFALLSPSIASADIQDAMFGADPTPDDAAPAVRSRGYLAAGTMAGVDDIFRFGGTLEGGVRIGDSPLFVHGLVGAGAGGGIYDEGTYLQLRAGVEARTCTRTALLCGFAGADLALTSDSITRDADYDHAMHRTTQRFGVVPRIGGELGRTIKLRASIEAPIYAPTVMDDATVGLAFNLGLGYAF